MKAIAPCLLALGLVAALPSLSLADDAAANPAQGDTTSSGDAIQVSGPTSHMSSALSAALTAELPKYQPPPKLKPKTLKPVQADEEDPGLEEADADGSSELAADQPKNKIIRLPKYVVEGDRPPVFRESDIYTKKGLAMLAMDRYLSSFDRNVLNRFTIPFFGISAADRATQMYYEDQRLKDMADVKTQAANAAAAGESAESKYLLKESNRTFIRSGGMDWTSLDNSSGP